MTIELAACVLLVPDTDYPEHVFAASRRDNHNAWGIPGGKQDPHETNLDCAVREIYEETGFSLRPSELVPIYTGICYGKDGRNFWVTTYLYTDELVIGQLMPEDGILVALKPLISLTATGLSPFASYNLSVISAYRNYLAESK